MCSSDLFPSHDIGGGGAAVAGLLLVLLVVLVLVVLFKFVVVGFTCD